MNRLPWLRLLLIPLLSLALLLVWAFYHLMSPQRWLAFPDVSARQLQAHLKYLSSDELVGRLSGTPGAEKAAQYVVCEFRSYGLSPGGGNGGYLEPFTFVAGVRLGKANRVAVLSFEDLAVEASSQQTIVPDRHELQLGRDFMPLAFSQSGTFQGNAL